MEYNCFRLNSYLLPPPKKLLPLPLLLGVCVGVGVCEGVGVVPPLCKSILSKPSPIDQLALSSAAGVYLVRIILYYIYLLY